MISDATSSLTAVLAAEAVADAHPHHGPAPAHPCLNCGAALADRFCPHCGQPADTHRITLKHLVFHDLPHSIWHVDKGLVFTLKEMLTRPGLAIREYLAGQRARHFRPISYLLLLTGVISLIMSAIDFDYTQGRDASKMPELFRLVMERYMHFNLKYPALVQIIILPANSLVAWLLLRRRTGLYFAELLLGSAFISGTLGVINTVIMTPAILAQGTRAMGSLTQLVWLPMFLYPLWVNAQLQLPEGIRTARRYARAIGIAVAQMVVFLLYVISCMAIITALVLRERPDLKDKLKAKAAAKTAAAARR